MSPLARFFDAYLSDPIADLMALVIFVILMAIIYKRPDWRRFDEGHRPPERKSKKRFG